VLLMLHLRRYNPDGIGCHDYGGIRTPDRPNRDNFPLRAGNRYHATYDGKKKPFR
jgi:hypothetical protein